MENTFQTVNEFKKVYEEVRNDILERHGFKKGDKVKLKNAIMMYQKFNDQWIKRSSVKTDMIDTIKMQSLTGKDVEFTLKAMV